MKIIQPCHSFEGAHCVDTVTVQTQRGPANQTQGRLTKQVNMAQLLLQCNVTSPSVLDYLVLP